MTSCLSSLFEREGGRKEGRKGEREEESMSFNHQLMHYCELSISFLCSLLCCDHINVY